MYILQVLRKGVNREHFSAEGSLENFHNNEITSTTSESDQSYNSARLKNKKAKKEITNMTTYFNIINGKVY